MEPDEDTKFENLELRESGRQIKEKATTSKYA